MCKISRGISSVSTAVIAIGHSTKLHYCIKGLHDVQRQQQPCESRIFDIFKQEIYGLPKKMMITYPQKNFDCSYFFGLAYLYLSCFDSCENAKCPLTRPVEYTDCQGQFKDRAYTLVNNQYLTVVARENGVYTNKLFPCNNGLCVKYDKVCNLIDDCGDGSDENSCRNHHQCGDNRTYISLSQKCDGQVNCEDWSDECNDQCGGQIINGWALKAAAFVIGVLALILNVVFIIESSLELLKGNVKFLILINRILVLIIGLGDFMIGLHLFSVAVADRIYGGSFCNEQVKWFTSRFCSALGVISTIGAQISLFSLTLLSMFRAVSIKSNQIPTNQNVTNAAQNNAVHFLKIIVFVVMPLIVVTTLIAVAPLLPPFEDFFVNGLAYNSSVKLFTEQIDKNTHFDMIQGYFGRAKKQTLKWSLIVSLVKDMFSNDYGNLKVHKVDFYGNDGVCVFKYFVNYDDPQRVYSLSVQVINVLCFIIVAVCYIIINTTTVKNSNILTKAENPTAKLIRKRNKKLRQKITAIIVTDFACWIPFVVVSFLHFFEVFDASTHYGLFSIVLLPLNSIINPFFYSNYIGICAAKLNVASGLAERLSRFFRRIHIRDFWKRHKTTNNMEPGTNRVEDTNNHIELQIMSPN